MKVNSRLLKRLRAEKHWSQEQLSDACGLSLRTIQRLETTGKASLESVKALATVFEIEPDELILSATEKQNSPFEVVKLSFMRFSNFSDTASRYEFWWFFLFIFLLLAIAAIISNRVLEVVALVVLLPFIAVGTRRLKDGGYSSWWQLLYFVPFGVVVVLYMMAQDTKNSHSIPVS